MSSREPLDIESGVPLASAEGYPNLPPPPRLRGPLKPVAETSTVERIVAILAACAVVTAILAIVFESSAIVILAGLLSVATGPYAYLQQTKLTDIRMLHETNRVIKAEADRLEAENERIVTEIADVRSTIDKLCGIEQALDIIAGSQGQSVAELEKQLQKNREILATMRKSTKGRIIQNLIHIVTRGDKNLDDTIDANEADAVVRNLNKISGVTVHEDRLRRRIVGKSVDSIIDVAQNLLAKNMPKDERIFDIEEDE